MSRNSRLPLDKHGHPIQKGMGVPLVTPSSLLLGVNKFVDVIDLSLAKYEERIFHGIMIENLSSSFSMSVSLGESFSTDEDLVIQPSKGYAFDGLLFGPNEKELSKDQLVTKIRARINGTVGTAASATIDYSGSGNPSDGETVNVNGKVYEFSSDASKTPSNDYLVTIGGTADTSWTNFMNQVNAKEQALTVTIDTGTDTVTLTSNYGGAYGDGLVIADGATPTGAIFSGNTAGGSGGVGLICHVW